MLSKGQLVSVTFQITSGPSSPGTQDDLNKIQDILGASGITVISAVVENGLFGFSGSLLWLGSSYLADFQVEVDQDYNQVGDFVSVIQNAIYQVTGNLPSLNGVPVVTGLSSAIPPAPPNPGIVATTVISAADTVKAAGTGIVDALNAALSKITNTVWTLIAILVGLVVLILILFAYKPEFARGAAHAAAVFV